MRASLSLTLKYQQAFLLLQSLSSFFAHSLHEHGLGVRITAFGELEPNNAIITNEKQERRKKKKQKRRTCFDDELACFL